MRYLLFIISVSVLGIACDNDKDEMPIERDKLITVLVDVHVAEAAMQELPSEKRDSLGKVYYQKIFSLHGVTEADFNKSMFLIRQDPEDLEALYKEVISTLEKKDEEVRKQMK